MKCKHRQNIGGGNCTSSLIFKIKKEAKEMIYLSFGNASNSLRRHPVD